MITNYNPVVGTPLAKPAYLIPAEDPVYNSQIIRACNNATDANGNPIPIPTVGGTWHGVWSRHRYSKRQPWNSDMTRLLIDQKVGGNPNRLILDATTFAPLWGAIGGASGSPQRKLADSTEVQWRPGYPTQMVSVRGSGSGGSIKVEVWDVNTGATVGSIMTIPTTATAAFPTASVDFGWTGEAQISDDGVWTAFITRFIDPQLNPSRKDWMVVVNLETCVVGVRTDVSYATNAYPSGSRGLIGNVGISCLGNYVEVKLSGADPDVGTGYAAQPSFILDVDKNNFHIDPCIIHEMDEQSLRMGTAAARGAEGATLGLIPWMSHPTMNLDSLGQEVVVGASRVWENSNWLAYSATGSPSDPGTEYGHLIMVYPATGRHIHVSPGRRHIGDKPANVQHVSGMAYQRRGWEYITTEMGSAGRWAAGEIQAIKLTANLAVTAPRSIERYCLHRSNENKICDTSACVAAGHTGGGYNSEAHAAPSPDGSLIAFASNWCGIGAVVGSDPQTAKKDNKGYIVRPAGTASPPPPPAPSPDPDPVLEITTGPYERSPTFDYFFRDRRTGELLDPGEVVDALNELWRLQGGVGWDPGPQPYASQSAVAVTLTNPIIGTQASFTVTNAGDATLTLTGPTSNASVSVAVSSSSLAPGEVATITLTMTAIPGGPTGFEFTYETNELVDANRQFLLNIEVP